MRDDRGSAPAIFGVRFWCKCVNSQFTPQSHVAIPAPVRGFRTSSSSRGASRDDANMRNDRDRASAKGVQRPPVTVCRTTPSASVHARINSVTDCRRTQRSPRDKKPGAVEGTRGVSMRAMDGQWASSSLCKRDAHISKRRRRRACRPAHWGVEPHRLHHCRRRDTGHRP